MYNRVKLEIRWHIELVSVLIISLAIVYFSKYPLFLANHKHSKKPRFLNDSSIHCGGTPANYENVKSP